MPIVTLAQVKALTGITGTDYDTQISAYIPIVQSQIVDYTNNNFTVNTVKYNSTTIAFNDDDPDTITDSESKFVEEGFTNGIDLLVSGSINNDGIYEVDTAIAGTITLTSTESLIGEAVGADVTLTRVKFPASLQIVASKMIMWNINAGTTSGKKSERLGDYQYTNGDTSGSGALAGYPSDIVGMLEAYLKVRVI